MQSNKLSLDGDEERFSAPSTRSRRRRSAAATEVGHKPCKIPRSKPKDLDNAVMSALRETAEGSYLESKVDTRAFDSGGAGDSFSARIDAIAGLIGT